MNKKYSIKNCKEFAVSKNGRCLSTTYINSNTKLEWECQFGHRWYNHFAKVLYGRWCPYCGGSKKRSIEYCQEIASKMNGSCLSTIYINSKNKMRWKCDKHHVWNATLHDIVSGAWCPYCAKRPIIGIVDCTNMAHKNNGICLSTTYINSKTALAWQCNSGHVWSATYSNVKRGTWCPECNKNNKIQTKLLEILRGIFSNYYVISNYRGFEWLKVRKNGAGLEIDIYIPEIKLAIEYDGEQHFYPVKLFGGSKTFYRRKQLDKLKDKKIKEHPEDIEYFIRFNYKEKNMMTEEYILKKLEENGVSR